MSIFPKTDAFVKAHHAKYPDWDWQDHASSYLDHAERMEGRLSAIMDEIEGYIDGAPDASEASKLANRIAEIINPTKP